MNDKNLDQLLREALRPEVSEDEVEVWEEISQRKKIRSMRKHAIIKTGIAVAACVALVMGIGYGHLSEIVNDKRTQKPVPTSTKETLTSGLNSFAVTVSAAEVKKKKTSADGKEQPKVYATPSYDSIWCGEEGSKNTVSYMIKAPIICNGKNIQSITYTINKGHFLVVSAKDSKYLITSESKLKDAGHRFGVVEEKSEKSESDYGQQEFTSFTVSGTEKPEEKFGIFLVGESKLSGKSFDSLFRSYDGNNKTEKMKAHVEEMKARVEEMKARVEATRDTVITCTATYRDGSKKSVDIKVGADILTAEEAGEVETSNAESEKGQYQTKDIYTTFEVK